MPRIYIVEDDRDLAWVLNESFSLAGYTVVTAPNGLDALQHMRRRPPDLVVLDVNMPVMDGFALARRMRADPLLTWVPILFLTVHSDFPSKAEGFRAGGDDYVVKPFDLPELHARARAILRRCRTDERPDKDTVHAGNLTLNLPANRLQIGGHSIQLTGIETDILRYLMSRPGISVSVQQLLEGVLDYPAGTGDPSAVRWHIKNLRQKIEADPTHPVHLVTAPPRGYSFS